MILTKGKLKMKNGTSTFRHEILSGAVELDVRIDFDEYGDADFTIEANGFDVTEDVLSYGLEDDLLDKAIDFFIPDSDTRAEFQYECAKNGD